MFERAMVGIILPQLFVENNKNSAGGTGFACPPGGSERDQLTENILSICSVQNFSRRNLSEFRTTDSDEALIAKAAKIGPIRMPKNGNRTPAAIGTPEAL